MTLPEVSFPRGSPGKSIFGKFPQRKRNGVLTFQKVEMEPTLRTPVVLSPSLG